MLWTNLHMDDDGEWLYDALIGGTLEISHNGSYLYLNDLARDLCACVVVFHCIRTNKYADLMWAERSTSQIVTNYGHHREILECLATQLLMNILLDGKDQ